MTKNKKTGLSENWSIDKSSIENGPVKYDEKGYPDKATPQQVGAMAERLEEMRQMTGSDGRYDKPKPKKKVMEPIEIPEIISVRPYQRNDTNRYFGRLDQPTKTEERGQYKILPEVNPGVGRYPKEADGLSRTFTQDKLREGQILKQLNKEMANDERKNTQITNEGEDK